MVLLAKMQRLDAHDLGGWHMVLLAKMQRLDAHD